MTDAVRDENVGIAEHYAGFQCHMKGKEETFNGDILKSGK